VPFDLTVHVEDQPGVLAALGEATGRAGINLDGFCCLVVEGKGVGHLLVEDGEAARKVLADAGFRVGEPREVLVVEAEDRPGALGALARRFANAGVNLELAYVSAGGRLVLGPDDLARGRSAL
jgi:hypothetical protein